MITIDEIELPMQSNEEMLASRKRALKLTNSLANSKEPKSTVEATNCVVQILDATYKKADLQAIAKGFTHQFRRTRDATRVAHKL